MAGIFTHYTYMVIVVLILTAEVKAQFFTVPIGRKPKPVQAEQQNPTSNNQSTPYSGESAEAQQGNASESLPSSDCQDNAASHSGKSPSNNDGSRVSFSGERDAGDKDYHKNGRTKFSLPLRRIRITSPYGMRRHPIYRDLRFHNGIDLTANYEPVYAMLDGIVTKVGSNPSAGKYVTLQHSPDLEITYMHLSRIHVTKGDRILSGELVARSGNTGCSCSPHLHIKATYRHRSLNPIHILRLFKHR